MILQQTGNFLLACLQSIEAGNNVSSPLGSIDFLNDLSKIQKRTFSGKMQEPGGESESFGLP